MWMWLYFVIFFFFFSSRRRHTRLVSDWSSDVCSSDLLKLTMPSPPLPARTSMRASSTNFMTPVETKKPYRVDRSEERRVGKECRARWWQDNEKKKVRDRGR